MIAIALREGGGPVVAAPAPPNFDDIEHQLQVRFSNRQGYDLVRIAQRVLREVGAEQVYEQILLLHPDETAEINAQNLINEIMNRIRNPRS